MEIICSFREIYSFSFGFTLKSFFTFRQKRDCPYFGEIFGLYRFMLFFCQIYVKKLILPIPEFEINDVEMFFKVKYDNFCKWIQNPEDSLSLYSPTGDYLKDAAADEWFLLRKKEFTTIVQPYIDKQK